jgi:hypothetical protein
LHAQRVPAAGQRQRLCAAPQGALAEEHLGVGRRHREADLAAQRGQLERDIARLAASGQCAHGALEAGLEGDQFVGPRGVDRQFQRRAALEHAVERDAGAGGIRADAQARVGARERERCQRAPFAGHGVHHQGLVTVALEAQPQVALSSGQLDVGRRRRERRVIDHDARTRRDGLDAISAPAGRQRDLQRLLGVHALDRERLLVRQVAFGFDADRAFAGSEPQRLAVRGAGVDAVDEDAPGDRRAVHEHAPGQLLQRELDLLPAGVADPHRQRSLRVAGRAGAQHVIARMQQDARAEGEAGVRRRRRARRWPAAGAPRARALRAGTTRSSPPPATRRRYRGGGAAGEARRAAPARAVRKPAGR